MEIVILSTAAVGAIGAVAATIVAKKALDRASQIAATQLFVDLRRSHADVQAKMDPRYHNKDFDPRDDPDPEVLRSLERYWLHTVTEWYATTRLGKGEGSEIWGSFYVPAVEGALRNRPLRVVFLEMMYGQPGSTFSGFGTEFGEVVAAIYPKEHRQELGRIAPQQPKN